METEEPSVSLLRVEGQMLHEDAVLLEKIALELKDGSGGEILIDLAELDFLDSDAAVVLRRMTETHGFRIEGVETLVQTAIDAAERSL